MSNRSYEKTTNQHFMKEDIFEIQHSNFGNEEYFISNANYNIYQTEEGIWEFVICFETSKAVKRADKLAERTTVLQNFEATAVLDPKDIKLETGKIIIQKQGYDEDREEYLSNFYYFEHNSVEELEIKIVAYHADYIIINAIGKAIVSRSNGNEPDSELVIHSTRFQLDKELERGVM